MCQAQDGDLQLALSKQGKLVAAQVSEAAAWSVEEVQQAATAAAMEAATAGEDSDVELEADEEEAHSQESDESEDELQAAELQMLRELAQRLAASQRHDGRERRSTAVASQMKAMQLAGSKVV